MVFAVVNRRKLFAGKDLRFAGPAPPTLSRCGVRVYVDSAIGIEVVPLLSLIGLTIVIVFTITRVAASTASLVLKTQRDFPAVIAVSYKIHDNNS